MAHCRDAEVRLEKPLRRSCEIALRRIAGTLCPGGTVECSQTPVPSPRGSCCRHQSRPACSDLATHEACASGSLHSARAAQSPRAPVTQLGVHTAFSDFRLQIADCSSGGVRLQIADCRRGGRGEGRPCSVEVSRSLAALCAPGEMDVAE
eukprot:7294521-Prymnesium_polylepis.1